ncbi:MAG: DNA polymerase III subunit gamma/tau, partial [Succinivibrio sp.]
MTLELNGQYQALARKYRPQHFDDVVGQEHVIGALKNSIKENRIHHAYLLTGTRGIGKTTIARIIAKCLECEAGVTDHPHSDGSEECSNCLAIAEGRFPDVIEIDAASQTKVDDTRALLENTQYPPMQGRYKVYIIDEVHMLSQSSFNALLKTLEEPPQYVKFILATTDPHKIPPTVLSRCLQFQLKALTVDQIALRIEDIAKKEGINAEHEACVLLARAAKGSMRDALSLCDQAVALGGGEILRDHVVSMLGTAGDNMIVSILDLLTMNSTADLADVISRIRSISPNYKNLLDELVIVFHDLALFQMTGGESKLNVF